MKYFRTLVVLISGVIISTCFTSCSSGNIGETKTHSLPTSQISKVEVKSEVNTKSGQKSKNTWENQDDALNYIKSLPGIKRFNFNYSYMKTNNVLKKNKVNMDFNGDGRLESLNLSLLKSFPKNVETNKPVKIKMEINRSKVVYTNLINDNVYLFVTDINLNDGCMDICIVSTGTDVSDYGTTIYRCDGKRIYKCGAFCHYAEELYFDKSGNVYFSAYRSSDGKVVPKVFKYNSSKAKFLF